MTPLVAAVAVLLVAAGATAAAAGVRGTPAVSAPGGWLAGAARQAAASRGGRISVRSRRLLAAGTVAGLAAWLVTGWAVAVLVLPAAVAGLPALLLAPPGSAPIARLEAMEEWTRSLSGTLTVGVGLEQALIATLRSTPAAIRPEVAILVARLRASWTTTAALRAFADDLDDATGDLIAASLLLGAQRRGDGLAAVLDGLAQTVADDVRVRRAIEADRAKPRATARWITLITLVVLGVLALNGTYIAPYGTPLGQLALLGMLGAYVGALLWLRRMARGTRLPRLVGRGAAEGGVG